MTGSHLHTIRRHLRFHHINSLSHEMKTMTMTFIIRYHPLSSKTSQICQK
ncbi:hypothetical protein HanHA300_Chr13g0474701 [Helianthus annuus]|nr:hypothetical protein HanHA300_Chr13g0474701 [Helianthus annuus]KAJ0497017.1 hypothetical protein HanHA89_Chr13g0506621 [Helianthus annuus]KAJ0663048.1 hypothetical protein HanLR1_Chr13g0476781 [Helianthus annuus]KAJ0670543.1 hypothetical protein HanOQP8_Chr13g0475561 [Helianthus annuus]